MREKDLGYCWYCSEVRELGDPDHVIPGTLFAHKNQATLTLPCCQACNTKKSHGETELAVNLLARKESSAHPAAQHMWPEVERATRKNLSKVARAGAAATLRPHITKSGLYLGHEMIADLGDVAQSIVQSLRFMIHGLHVIAIGELLPKGTPLEVIVIPPEYYRSTLQKLGPGMNRGPYGLGPGQATVRWVGRLNDREPHLGIWLVEFFESVLVAGFVGAAVSKSVTHNQRPQALKGAKKRQAERMEQLGLVLAKPDDYLELLGNEKRRRRKLAGGLPPGK